jgi:hypothetical protein
MHIISKCIPIVARATGELQHFYATSICNLNGFFYQAGANKKNTPKRGVFFGVVVCDYAG